MYTVFSDFNSHILLIAQTCEAACLSYSPFDRLPNYAEKNCTSNDEGRLVACVMSYLTVAYTCMPEQNCCWCEKMPEGVVQLFNV